MNERFPSGVTEKWWLGQYMAVPIIILPDGLTHEQRVNQHIEKRTAELARGREQMRKDMELTP